MGNQLKILGIRGATTVESNSAAEIENATIELLNKIINENSINEDHIASVFFTLTPDLNADFPAKYARIHLGWNDVPMICMQEIPVPNSLPMCIRVLIQLNTTKNKTDIKHSYLRNASKLRPDLISD